MDVNKTVAEHRRLLVIGGWLSLVASTCHIDLHQIPAVSARLRTAAQLARHAEHPEIAAWCLEPEAWQAIIDGDYRRAVTLASTASPGLSRPCRCQSATGLDLTPPRLWITGSSAASVGS